MADIIITLFNEVPPDIYNAVKIPAYNFSKVCSHTNRKYGIGHLSLMTAMAPEHTQPLMKFPPCRQGQPKQLKDKSKWDLYFPKQKQRSPTSVTKLQSLHLSMPLMTCPNSFLRLFSLTMELVIHHCSSRVQQDYIIKSKKWDIMDTKGDCHTKPIDIISKHVGNAYIGQLLLYPSLLDTE